MSAIVLKPSSEQIPRAAWEEKIDLIKSTVAKGATDTELELFLYQARKSGLDPLARQIHCVRRWNAKAEKMEMAIQTGIDGYRLIADRTGKYCGSDEPIDSYGEDGLLLKSTVTIWKMIDGQRCGFTASARWSEYYPGDKQGFMWRKMPHVMLSKCAEALALRKAFPAELSGLYTFEEMAQAGPQVIPAMASDGEVTLECEDCAQPISDWKGEINGKKFKYTLAQVLVIARKLHEKDLCGNCLERRKETRVDNAQEKADTERTKRAEKKLEAANSSEAEQQWTHLLKKPSDIEKAVNKVANAH
jgi:phage recombination protein Bet